MTVAINETDAYLADLRGLDFKNAFALSSTAVDFRVTQVVDGTKGIHAMILKRLFTTGAPTTY